MQHPEAQSGRVALQDVRGKVEDAGGAADPVSVPVANGPRALLPERLSRLRHQLHLGHQDGRPALGTQDGRVQVGHEAGGQRGQ